MPAAALPRHPHVLGAARPQLIDQIAEELHVTALIRGHGDRVRVLLDHRFDDLVDRAFVAEVDHLSAERL